MSNDVAELRALMFTQNEIDQQIKSNKNCKRNVHFQVNYFLWND